MCLVDNRWLWRWIKCIGLFSFFSKSNGMEYVSSVRTTELLLVKYRALFYRYLVLSCCALKPGSSDRACASLVGTLASYSE